MLRPKSLQRLAVTAALLSLLLAASDLVASESSKPLSLVVMDPLAAPLSCPCVEGYAQRDYEVLGRYLQKVLSQPVTVTFSDSLSGAMKKIGDDRADLIIGKDSVVRSDAQAASLEVKAVGRLTDRQGAVTQTGLIVVRSADTAKRLEDLKGYRVLFGPPDCEEKNAAARALLVAAGLELPSVEQSETSAACSDGACKIIEWGDSERAATVISSYAAPLLEGCGTIKKGDLRVVGETSPVPFITAFVTDQLTPEKSEAVTEALLEASKNPKLLLALESLVGFIEIDDASQQRSQKTPAAKTSIQLPTPPAVNEAAPNTLDWSQWRGPNRNGRVEWLPDNFGATPKLVWKNQLFRPGLGASRQRTKSSCLAIVTSPITSTNGVAMTLRTEVSVGRLLTPPWGSSTTTTVRDQLR